MRGLWSLVIICVLIIQTPANALLFQKKDYGQIILNNASNAEKRKDYKSAFHSYEKGMYYYKKNQKIVESYAKFCERSKYLDKAEELYTKLYLLTKDMQYLFKVYICSIKNGKFTNEQIQKIIEDKTLTSAQKKELKQSLIFHFAYKKDWKRVKKTCDSLPTKDIGTNIIKTCIAACEKTSDKKGLLKYYIRDYEFSKDDSSIINKVISTAESINDVKMQEIFVKKLSELNPNDNGIKYKLAGVYEKQKDWKKAAKVYENLIISGDKSEHVKNSYAYILSQLQPKKQPLEKPARIYLPKKLSGLKLAEKNFYDAWKEKNYDSAQKYLSEMLKEQPNNKKLHKHRVDIDVSQENYSDAITNFEKIKTSSITDAKYLAFLYSKTENNLKALEIIKNSIQENPNNIELLNLALEYSMSLKDWDNAVIYTEKLLVYEPKSEKLLKNAGDLYSINKDFVNAIEYYKKLVEHYPKAEYQEELANLYMANKEFETAQTILEPLYKNTEDKNITDAYLNSLLAQNKTKDAYWVIKDRKLENTPEGYIVLGDVAMQYKHYDMAEDYYFKALQFNPKNTELKNKLAGCYRLMGYKNGAGVIYEQVLREEPNNLEARLGLGSLETDKKHFDNARKIFKSILIDNPDYKPAKVAITHSYIANDEKLAALEELNKLPDDDETNYMKAQVFYNMNMRSDSKDEIKYTDINDARDLKYKIKRDNAITIIPAYTSFYQTLANEFRLNYQKYGVQISQDVNKNANAFMEYNVYWYMSGANNFLSNVTNEFKGGIQQRPNKKWEYRTDLGVKAFQGQGGMLLTNSWLKYYFNDWFNLKLGFYRNNVEQSYTSAVGQYISGIYTGQVAENRVYLEYDAKLPRQFYSFGRGSYGLMTAQNMPTNQFFEGYIGIGKAFYNNSKNPLINTFAFDVVSYNSAYQYNLLNLYSNTGQLFGGYFSPSYFNATTGNLKIEGYIKKLRLKYGVKAFGGIQTALTPDQQTPTYGYNPYVALDINDHMTLNASYNHFNYADLQRDIFMFNLVIKGFKKDAKNKQYTSN